MKPAPWILVLGLLGALSLPAQAQTPTDWYYDKPISEVRFDGLVNVQRSDIDGVTRPYVGKKFSESVFQDLQTALYNLDYFDGLIVPTAIKANPEGSAVILLFKVTEKPVVENIEFSGNEKIRSSELEGSLTVKKGDIINQSKIKNDEKTLENYYRDRGFLDVSVSSTTEDIDKQKTKVIFKVKEGIQNAVKSIQFQGNVFASSSTLTGMMDTKAQGLFDNGLFKESAFTKDLRTIETYYWNHGYIDARVVDVQRNVTFDVPSDRNVLNIVLTIKEGEAMTFGGFTFEGNQIFTKEELQALVRQEVGKTMSKEKLEADYQRVVDLYLENGYIFNNISRQEIRDGQSIKYKITIVERPRAHIENIVVKGNTKTKDNVILREMPVEVGDVFSKAKIVSGIRNLNNLQYFSSVTPETPQGSADGLMDLILNVEEAKTADISFGLAYSGTADFPLSATVKWSDKNFMGEGLTLGVDSSLSPDIQSINLTTSENWFMDQRITLGGQLGFTHALNTKIDQAIQNEAYNSSTSNTPDPYRDTDYVFVNSGYWNNTYHNAGDPFPYVPTASQISSIPLETRYQYDLNNGTVSKNAQMEYNSWAFNAGVNTGYSWYTPLGRFGLGTGEKSTLQYVTYDDTIYRPASYSLRLNLNNWMLSNQWWTKGTWDTRDYVANPSSGFDLGETLTFSGGFLGGSTHYTRYDTKAEDYFKFISWPVVEGYSLDMILRLRTGFSFLTASNFGLGPIMVQPTDELYIDGMQSGRGWGYQYDGQATWTSGVEIRTPVPFAAQFLWIDTFLDDAVMIAYGTSVEEGNPFNQPITAHELSWGSGLRIVSPQFPLALYLAKPFKINTDGSINWSPTTTSSSIFGMVLVVAFGTSY